MPCSRSASSPSASREKSVTPSNLSAGSAWQSCSSRPIRVDLPSSTEPQVSRRSKEAAIYFTVIPAKAGTSGQEVSAGHGGLAGREGIACRLVEDQQGAVARDGRPLGGEIERGDGQFLARDIGPDVALRPIGEREDAQGFAGRTAAIVELPEFGPLL